MFIKLTKLIEIYKPKELLDYQIRLQVSDKMCLNFNLFFSSTYDENLRELMNQFENQYNA